MKIGIKEITENLFETHDLYFYKSCGCPSVKVQIVAIPKGNPITEELQRKNLPLFVKIDDDRVIEMIKSELKFVKEIKK